MDLLPRGAVVHTPELDRAAPSALELDDHEQLLAVLGAEIVLGDLPASRDLALDHEIVAQPTSLDLDVPASLYFLGDLPAVVVEYQRRAAIRSNRDARVGLGDRECGGRIERELHCLVHPLALLVAHSGPTPASRPAAAPAAEAPASTKTATTPTTRSGVPAPRPAPARLVAARVAPLEHVPRIVALCGVERPLAGEIRVLSRHGGPGNEKHNRHRQSHGATPRVEGVHVDELYTNGRRRRLTRRIAVSEHEPPIVSLSVRSAPSTSQVRNGSGRAARDRQDAAGVGSSTRGSNIVGEYRGVSSYGPDVLSGDSCARRHRARRAPTHGS